jgi:hypothetical protein
LEKILSYCSKVMIRGGSNQGGLPTGEGEPGVGILEDKEAGQSRERNWGVSEGPDYCVGVRVRRPTQLHSGSDWEGEKILDTLKAHFRSLAFYQENSGEPWLLWSRRMTFL